MYSKYFFGLCAVWVAFEIGLALSRRAGAGTAKKDRGTLALLNIVIYAAVGLGVFLGMSRIGLVRLPAIVRWAGLGVIIAGLALRVWAIVTLGRFFTVDVAIHDGHQIVRGGPYRIVRHPAYTGALLSFVGLALAVSSWVSALVVLLPVTAAFIRRIAIEEVALAEAFPSEYQEYVRRTKKLVPGIY